MKRSMTRLREVSTFQAHGCLPRYTKAYVYPAHFQTRRVNDAGDISWHKNRVFISEVFRGEDIGLEKIENHFYKIYFRNLEVGEFDINDMRFRPGFVREPGCGAR